MAVPVAIFDIGKAAVSVWAAQLLDLGVAQQVSVGICAIVGHNWPVFLRFRGGRGILASLGVITMMSPKLGLIALVMSYLLAPIRQVALGVFLALVSLPLFSWFLSQPLDISERLPVTQGFAAIGIIAFAKRLLAPRTPLSKSVRLGELLANRILFDRDIADRKAWIGRLRSEDDPTDETLEQREEKA